MIMTQFAMMDPGPAGNSLFSRCCRGIAQFFGFGDRPDHPTSLRVDAAPAHQAQETARAALHIVPTPESPVTPITDMKWRRHEQLRRQPAYPLDADERQARQHAVRGLYAACAGDLVEAERHFADAARHESIDLSELPGFWTLPRNTMMIAVHAYEAAGRLREASALSARIRTQFRPRALAPIPQNVTELSPRHASLTGNS